MANLDEVFGVDEDISKIPGKSPGFLRFWVVAERVKVWYNRDKKD